MDRAYSHRILAFGLRLLLLLSVAVVGVAQNEQQEQWKETLQFGIDSEVESIIPQLEQSGVNSLDASLVERFAASRSDELREQIISYFERRESDALIEPVRSLLLADNEPSEQLLRAGASYLTSMDSADDEELLDLYVEFADDSGILTATVAVEAIGESGAKSAVERLVALYEDQRNTDVRAAILRALGMTGREDALSLLTSVAEDEFEQSALRHYATESIGRIGSDASIALLEQLLSEQDSVLRAYATLALGFYPADQTAAILNEALLDSFWRVRVAALEGLAEQRNVEAVPAIAYKARRDPERPVRAEAVQTLGRIGTPEAMDVLAEIARSVRAAETERMTALSLLIDRDAQSREQLLLDLLAEEWEREGSRILDTIGKELSTQSDPALEPLFLRLLDHPNFVIQVYGIRGIGAAGLRSQRSRLESIARNTEGLLRTTAVTALEDMGFTFDPEADEEPEDVPTDSPPES